jgi:hypothetical protein
MFKQSPKGLDMNTPTTTLQTTESGVEIMRWEQASDASKTQSMLIRSFAAIRLTRPSV